MKIHFKYVPGDTTEVEIKQFFAQVGRRTRFALSANLEIIEALVLPK